MPSICELKMELKAKGIKGITGLNKSGLEKLLSGGKTEAKPQVPKPKPFTPAPTKGESPKVAEKKIDKKVKAPTLLRLTYKEPKKEAKPKRISKAMKFYNEHKARIDGFLKNSKKELIMKANKIEDLMKRAGTEGEKKQATMQYEIIMAAIMMKKD